MEADNQELKPGAVTRIAMFILVLTAITYSGCQVFPAKDDFYGYSGSWDHWRIPLKYPYEIAIIDTFDFGDLTTWEDSTSIVSGIQRYTVRNQAMMGIHAPELSKRHHTEWFSFNFDTGKVTYYSSKEEFLAAWRGFGFVGEPELKSIRENYDAYWANR